MQSKTGFVTGGTGFLGSFLIAFLLQKGNRVVALVRGSDPLERLLKVLREVGDGLFGEAEIRERLKVVEGDIKDPGFRIPNNVLRNLAHEVDEIWHCAASLKYQERDREEIVAHNIAGTKNLLEFSCGCNEGKGASFFYVSTAYVAPSRERILVEELPEKGFSYRNLYEWSKAQAELLVVKYREEYNLPVAIFRPTVIIGHSISGKAVSFNGYYSVFSALYFLTRNLAVNLGIDSDRDLNLRILAGPAYQLI